MKDKSTRLKPRLREVLGSRQRVRAALYRTSKDFYFEYIAKPLKVIFIYFSVLKISDKNSLNVH